MRMMRVNAAEMRGKKAGELLDTGTPSVAADAKAKESTKKAKE